MSRSVERHFRVSARQLGPGLDALEEALREERLPEEAVLDLRIVAEEVLTNFAKYGHDDDGEHWIRLRLTLVPGEVTLQFTDDGRPFNPLTASLPDPAEECGERLPGGLGLQLIRSLVETAEYARLGPANVLTLRKRLDGRHDVP